MSGAGVHERVDIADRARAAYRAMVTFDRSIQIDSALRELVKIRSSQINGCAYCIELHTRDARKAGESERRIYALSAWHESPLFTERERAALALTDAITNIAGTGLPDTVYEQAASHFAEDELANLVLAITAINAWNRIAISSGIVFTDDPAQ